MPRLRLILFSFLFVAILSLSWLFYALIKGSTTEPVIIQVDKSTTATQFAQTLEDKHLIGSSRFFLSLIRLQGLSNQLKAGVYELKPGETALQLLHKVVVGQVLVQNFTIIAGTTQLKVSEDLQKAPYLAYHQDAWSSIQNNHPNAEGLLLADTYQYPGGSESKTLLEQAHNNLLNFLNSSWNKRAADLPYKTPYELLIAASIIEKESAQANERKLIAGVIINRLKLGMPLQMDPTVMYGLLHDYKGKLTHKDLLIDSPYNSYRNRGLPPTPIAMVGKEAIEAAAHPTPSQYLYYVSKGDGTHEFSHNYTQQKQAIEHYQHKD